MKTKFTIIEGGASKIESLKQKARQLNAQGNQEELGKVISVLDEIWTDDRAAMAFYTQLEQTAPAA